MSIFALFLDLVFPKFCLQCGAFGTYLCGRCAATISFFRRPLCPGCMRPLAEIGIHQRCRRMTALDGLIVIAPFSGAIQNLLVGIKYHGWFAMAARLSQISTLVLEKNHPNWIEAMRPRVIIPVPLHPARLRERGFNQSELFTQSFSRSTGVQMSTRILQKQRQTAPQASLSRAERLKNNDEIYRCTIRLKKSDTILLVDDVVTTGATLSACAQALKKAGAGKVFALAIAHGK